MKLSLFIARRYLFAKKQFNVINIVTIVSAVAIAVVSMAMVCVLSVYNGYERMILDKVVDLDPQLLITSRSDAPFDRRAADALLRSTEGVETAAPIVWGEGLVSNGADDSFSVGRLCGVDSGYLRTTELQRYLLDGRASVHPGQYMLGASLASDIGTIVNDSHPVLITVPKRTGYINPVIPATSLRRSYGSVAGTLYSDNTEYDNTLFLHISELRTLLMLPEHQVHAIALRLSPGASEDGLKKQLSDRLGSEYLVKNRAEQQPHLMRLVAIEKWITFLIFTFVLFLAAYNVMAGISMLLISKEQDIRLIHVLGAPRREVRRIFQTEGMLVTLIGAAAGILIGLLLCRLQMRYGWLSTTMGGQTQPYPVLVKRSDLLWVALLIAAVGYGAAFYPVHKLLRSKSLRTENTML